MRTKRMIPAAALAAVLAFGLVGRAEPTPAVGSVSGTVTSADGKPVAGVTIKVTAVVKGKRPDEPAPKAADPTKPAKAKTGKVVATATTDEKGAFKIENVPTGTYVVTANLKDVGRARANVTVSAGQDFPLSMQLVKATKAAG